MGWWITAGLTITTAVLLIPPPYLYFAVGFALVLVWIGIALAGWSSNRQTIAAMAALLVAFVLALAVIPAIQEHVTAQLVTAMETAMRNVGLTGQKKNPDEGPPPPKPDNPNVIASIEQIRTQRYMDDPNSDHVFLLVSVVNKAAPTIVEGYELTYEPGTVNSRLATALVIDKPILIYDNAGHVMDTIRPEDALYKKTYPNPLVMGAGARGWLWFIFRDFPFEKLEKKPLTLKLNFEDAYEHTFFTILTATLGNNPNYRRGFYPGLTGPVAKPQ
jgi:hypothetical protein